MHIAVNKRNGIPYASVMTSVREGKTVKKKSVMYLGRVLDRDRGIYKSVERGVFAYDLPKISDFGAVDDEGKRSISLWHKQTPGIPGVDFYLERLYNILQP